MTSFRKQFSRIFYIIVYTYGDITFSTVILIFNLEQISKNVIFRFLVHWDDTYKAKKLRNQVFVVMSFLGLKRPKKPKNWATAISREW